ncbi:metallophosphoesterase family protein [Sanguibacter antarcticus]|uniref:Icc-related predicted phosphoesterase n=1 Tax=Sanguibacter antarcticus TaxID=372484 RepID=A0A2A9E3J4_9MICO|nr:metallophosphoesterase [Sanguibacter antarcticus]PFG32770.1 Icc-related predicted phosphoesterase [Sanguibacter antarcticus]
MTTGSDEHEGSVQAHPETERVSWFDAVRRHPAWRHRWPLPPRWARWTMLGLLVVVSSAVFGITTSSIDASLGPHNARYEVTTNAVVTVDLGPLGTVQIESPVPLGIGVTVTIEEIPNDLVAVDSSATLEALSTDVEGYLQFFAGPDETISFVARALLEEAIRRTVAAILVVVAVGVLGYLVLGSARRRELGAAATRHTWGMTAVVVVGAMVGGVVQVDRAEARLDEVGAQASEVFEGTSFAGARITGRLSGVIDTYGGQLMSVYRDNEDFYAEANSNLAVAWQARAEHSAADETLLRLNLPQQGSTTDEDAATAEPDESSTDDATSSPSADVPSDEDPGSTTDDATDDATDEATDDATDETTPPEDDEDIVTLLLVSDLHCNTGMSPLITSLATMSGADVVLNGGDSTINGTSVERFCIESFASAVPDGVQMVQSDGNHDSALTSEQARDAGVIVLDGAVVEVAGVRILGDNDPNETRIGQGSTSATGESYLETGERLSDVACSERNPVDILLIHTPWVGEAVLESGCVPFQMSGHLHRRSGPLQVGEGMRYISSSTAGSVEGEATVGPLKGDAEMTVFRFDLTTRTMLDYQVVQVRADASADVGARVSVARPEPGLYADETEETPQSDADQEDEG